MAPWRTTMRDVTICIRRDHLVFVGPSSGTVAATMSQVPELLLIIRRSPRARLPRWKNSERSPGDLHHLALPPRESGTPTSPGLPLGLPPSISRQITRLWRACMHRACTVQLFKKQTKFCSTASITAHHHMPIPDHDQLKLTMINPIAIHLLSITAAEPKH
jgi:hypothetical protein